MRRELASGGGGFGLGAMLQWAGEQWREVHELDALKESYLALLESFQVVLERCGG